MGEKEALDWESGSHIPCWMDGWMAGEQGRQSLGLCLMLGSHGNAKRRAETPWLPRPVSLQGQWFLAQDVVAGKPNYSGMLCSNVLLLCPTHLRLGTPCTCLEDWCTLMLPYNLNTLSLSPPQWAPVPLWGVLVFLRTQ